MARLTRDADDSLISGEEFRVRRLALQLEQPKVMETLGVNRSTMDKWQKGYVNVPRQAREMLEMAEGDVSAAVVDLVTRNTGVLDAVPPHAWPWGDGTWYVALSLARHAIVESGAVAVIKGPPSATESEEEPAPPKKRRMIWNTDDGLPPNAPRD